MRLTSIKQNPIPDLERKEALKFCLEQLREADDFSKEIDWKTNIAPSLTVEELIGALLLGEHYKEENERLRKELQDLRKE